MIDTVKTLERAALEVRRDLLELCAREVIHIGGDLSVADAMVVLWMYQMRYNPENPQEEGRDRFVLSKGHASAVTSFCQAAAGCFPKEDILREYAADGGRFSMHSCRLSNPYVEFSTGSLGHGFPVACGIAQALRMKGNRTSRVYVVMGDGEQSEGSVWEAVFNSVHLGLGNLVALVDANGLEADGPVKELTALGNLAEKYGAAGWRVTELDGNSVAALKQALDSLPDACSSIPSVLVCHTVKGKGVSFMEGRGEWHAGKITEWQKDMALEELERAFYDKWGGD